MAGNAHQNQLEGSERAADSPRFDILAAAANSFMERGYSASSIDDVARRLGATKGRIYHYYPSKAALFADVFKTGMDMNYDAVLPEANKPGPPPEKLARMAYAHAENLIRTRPFQRAVWEGVEMHLRGATTPEQRQTLAELTAYRDRYSDMFKAVLMDAKKDGALAFDNVSVANQVMFVSLNSPIVWYSPRPGESDKDIQDLARQVVTFAMRGLGFKGTVKR